MHDQLGNHRVVKRRTDRCRPHAHRRPSTRPAATPKPAVLVAQATRANPRPQAKSHGPGFPAQIRASIREILACDRVNLRLRQRQRLATSRRAIATPPRSSPVTASVTGCSTCKRVFISMKIKVHAAAGSFDDELHRSGADIVHCCALPPRQPGAHALATTSSGQARRGRFFQSPFGDGAAPSNPARADGRLAVARRVAKHLDLTMPRGCCT